MMNALYGVHDVKEKLLSAASGSAFRNGTTGARIRGYALIRGNNETIIGIINLHFVNLMRWQATFNQVAVGSLGPGKTKGDNGKS